MFFLKKFFIIKNSENGSPCGNAILSKHENGYTLKINSTMTNPECDYILTIKNNSQIFLSQQIKTNSLKNFTIDIKSEIQNINNLTINLEVFNGQDKENISTQNNEKKANSSQIELNTPQVNQEKENTPFYENIKIKIEKMLNENEPFDGLLKFIENSRWVKVDVKNSSHYLLGIIYENKSPKEICYAIPSNKKFNPPKHLEEFCTFIETEKNGNGYYIMKQNATTGEAIK